MTDLKRITLRQALDETDANNEVLVGIDDYLERWNGHHILHLVVDYKQYRDFTAYLVEITRPRWLYGSEGMLSTHGLRFVGYVEDTSWAELSDGLSDEDWGKIPDRDDFLFAYQNNDKKEWSLMDRGIHPALEAYREKWKPVPY